MLQARERRHSSGGRWYWRRLRVMTTAEIGQRIAITLRHLNDDVAWRLAGPVWRRSWYPPLAGEEPRERAPFLAKGNADELRRADPDSCARIVERAEAVLAGRFAFFGYEETALRRPLDFALDVTRQFRWPAVHAKRLDYRVAGGDPKWIWELNRCQHVTLLVAAWLLTGREEFARCAADDMLEWIRSNPPGRGIAWANGYEAGLRAISLAIAADALRDLGALGVEVRRALLPSLWQHGRWIERDPSPGSSANNHRIGELVGLLAIAVLAPHLPDAGRWRSLALRELASEASRQILPDGGNAEQAFSYSVFTCDLLLVAAALARHAGIGRSDAIESALARAASAFAAQISDSEPPPRYGDSGEDRAVVLDGEEQRDARRVCAAIAALTGSRDARLVAPGLDATARWLFGKEGARRFADTAPAAPPGSRALVDTGLVVFRQGSSRALFDAGPLGYLSLAAHGHADALQVSLSDAGGELVSDPGVGSYFGHREWRQVFRGTGFHATVEVDGLDQSEPGGPFLWMRHARTTLHQVDLSACLAVGEHDGYMHLDDPVRHLRALALLPDGALLVYDRLIARGSHRVRQCWPLAPGLEASVATDGSVRVTASGRPRLAILFAGSPGTVSIATGQAEPFRGWWSPRLEAVTPAAHCAFEVSELGTVQVATLLTPAPGPWPAPRLTLVDEGDAVSFAVETGACHCRARLAFGDRPAFQEFHAERV